MLTQQHPSHEQLGPQGSQSQQSQGMMLANADYYLEVFRLISLNSGLGCVRGRVAPPSDFRVIVVRDVITPVFRLEVPVGTTRCPLFLST